MAFLKQIWPKLTNSEGLKPVLVEFGQFSQKKGFWLGVVGERWAEGIKEKIFIWRIWIFDAHEKGK